jgi:transcriptional regulator with XRE-family HTH domain
MAVETVQMPKPNPPRSAGAEDMVARRVAYERARRKWSREDLARRMTDAGTPVNQSAIYKIEQGSPRRTISLDEAHALADVFGITLDDLESIPEDVLSTEVAGYVDSVAELETVIRQLRGHILKLLARAADTANAARPMLDYMQSEPPWPAIRELEDRLTMLADLIIKVRDEYAGLRIGSEP